MNDTIRKHVNGATEHAKRPVLVPAWLVIVGIVAGVLWKVLPIFNAPSDVESVKVEVQSVKAEIKGLETTTSHDKDIKKIEDTMRGMQKEQKTASANIVSLCVKLGVQPVQPGDANP